ncbi:Hypothetical predicted protein [Octopus vulgaris]|uniref:Uncharacterized protein n=1 Tax=Octopus vulgaris TaxID=6645 RepID=A0AA36BFY2_OCTVU|nr:Hypothetical predicted protein [Octopus vulgaris]
MNESRKHINTLKRKKQGKSKRRNIKTRTGASIGGDGCNSGGCVGNRSTREVGVAVAFADFVVLVDDAVVSRVVAAFIVVH